MKGRDILGRTFIKVELVVESLNIADIYKRYNNVNNKELNQYGKELFSKFKIQVDNLTRSKGLYAFFKNDELIYIGRTHDSFANRVNTGYGNISPKNCYVDGQRTNCKMNSYINSALNLGNTIDFYVLKIDETETINELEIYYISELNPPLNGRQGKTQATIQKKTIVKPKQSIIRRFLKAFQNTDVKNNQVNSDRKENYSRRVVSSTAKTSVILSRKYKPLYLYLKNKNDDIVTLTFNEIENIIDAKLPNSAHNYREWWANEKNPQAKAHTRTWQEAGYEVSSVDFSNVVTFQKITL
ncbi:hypothetical protein RJG79_08670 [Mycoplasmatota bacterium WC44]